MTFDFYLFDLDNCLLNIPNPSEYFDNVLVETIERLTIAPLPNRQERNNFWSSGENYKEVLKIWGIGELNKFWLHFDEIDYKHRIALTERNELNLFHDVEYVLKKLKNNGKKLAIVSNTADYIVDYTLKQFKIEQFFDCKFGLGFDKDQVLAKPSPSGILKMLKMLDFNSEKSNAIMIGDSLVDVYAAKRAKVIACLIKRDLNKYPNGYSEWEYQPDFLIEKLDELFNL